MGQLGNVQGPLRDVQGLLGDVLGLGGVRGGWEVIPAALTALHVVLVGRGVVLGAGGSGRANRSREETVFGLMAKSSPMAVAVISSSSARRNTVRLSSSS